MSAGHKNHTHLCGAFLPHSHIQVSQGHLQCGLTSHQVISIIQQLLLLAVQGLQRGPGILQLSLENLQGKEGGKGERHFQYYTVGTSLISRMRMLVWTTPQSLLQSLSWLQPDWHPSAWSCPYSHCESPPTAHEEKRETLT